MLTATDRKPQKVKQGSNIRLCSISLKNFLSELLWYAANQFSSITSVSGRRGGFVRTQRTPNPWIRPWLIIPRTSALLIGCMLKPWPSSFAGKGHTPTTKGADIYATVESNAYVRRTLVIHATRSPTVKNYIMSARENAQRRIFSAFA